MSKREVIEVLCDRCKKVEVVSKESVKGGNEPEFALKFNGKQATYTDLCSRCRETLSGLYKKLTLQQPDEVKDAAVPSSDGPQKNGLLSRIRNTGA